ncbi:MAG: hypothetical protein AAB152_17505 [Candidatus Coatesbacteria bacterium]
MSLRHLTRLQNRTLADLLIGAAKAMGVAALLGLFFPSAAQDWGVEHLVGALLIAILLAILGFSILGRVGEAGGLEGGGRSEPKGRRRK